MPDHDLSSLYLQTTEVSIKPQGKLQQWGCAGTEVSVVTVEVISSCHQVSILSTSSYMCSFCQQLSWIWRWIKFCWRRQLNTCKEVKTQVKLHGLEVYILNLLYTKVKVRARDWILQRWPPAADLWSSYLWISSTWVDWHPSEARPSTWTRLHCATFECHTKCCVCS